MPIKRLTQSSLLDLEKYSSMLAGNPAFSPNSYDLLETTLISSNTTSITFSNLGSYSNYKHLQIRGVVRGDNGSTVRMRLNADTGNNYALHRISGNGSSVSSSAGSNASIINICFAMANSGNTSNAFSGFITDILDFSNTNKNTTIRSFGGNAQQAGFNTALALHSGLWMNTAAVTSITLFPDADNFVANSRFSLYGVK